MRSGIWTICSENSNTIKQWVSKIKEISPATFGNVVNDPALMNAVFVNFTNLPYVKDAMGTSATSFGSASVCKPPLTPDQPEAGRWHILQDWTSCSVACSGGYQFLHRVCIPGKNPKFGCIGPELMFRECNMQPCPATAVLDTDAGVAQNSTIKYVNVSTRPQIDIVKP